MSKRSNLTAEKIKSFIYLLTFIILLGLIIFLFYRVYIKSNLFNHEPIEQTQSAFTPLETVVNFSTSLLEKKGFFQLHQPITAEFNQQVMAVSTGLDAPAPLIDVGYYDPKIGESIVVYWQQPHDVEYDYVRVYRGETSSVQAELIADNQPLSGNYRDQNLENGVNYYYQVVAVRKNNADEALESKGNRVIIARATDSTPPSLPTDFKIENTENGHELLLTWTNPIEEDFSHVRIYRSLQQGILDTDGEVVEISDGNAYLDDTVMDNQIYYYTITAVDNNDNESVKQLLLSKPGNPDPFNSASINQALEQTNTESNEADENNNSNTNTN
ncbi:MAG: hypothetical protein V1898_05170 [Patescibacteria group bacterium]